MFGCFFMSNFKILKTEKTARLGEFETTHGLVKTPCFMNVATCGAIKGAVSAVDLAEKLKCQVALCNTYHLHLRPGDLIIKELGGLHKFMNWKGPILTDSGGFQVFSLAKIRQIGDDGVFFNSHINGKKIFIGPKQSMQIQSNLGSTIAMAFDECVGFPSSFSYAESSCNRTTKWLEICLETLQKLNSSGTVLNSKQLLFGINQGSTFYNLRQNHMKQIAQFNCDGYAIGGLAVGEPKNKMFETIEEVEPLMPANKPRYLMGVGTLSDIIEAVWRGVDLFDCVMPARNARHGHLNTWSGVINLLNAKYELDDEPIDERCGCVVCETYSKAYLRHLIKAHEVLAFRLCTMHNLWFYNNFMERIRLELERSNFENFRSEFSGILSRRI